MPWGLFADVLKFGEVSVLHIFGLELLLVEVEPQPTGPSEITHLGNGLPLKGGEWVYPPRAPNPDCRGETIIIVRGKKGYEVEARDGYICGIFITRIRWFFGQFVLMAYPFNAKDTVSIAGPSFALLQSIISLSVKCFFFLLKRFMEKHQGN